MAWRSLALHEDGIAGAVTAGGEVYGVTACLRLAEQGWSR